MKKRVDNVIGLCERRQRNGEADSMQSEKMKNIKMKIDMHNTKLMVSTSLLSVIVLATVANTSSFSTRPAQGSPVTDSSRGIASVQMGTSAWEDRVAKKLSEQTLPNEAQIGRKPSSLDQLTFGALEGKYTVRTVNGKINEIELADSESGTRPKKISDLGLFLRENNQLMLTAPVATIEPLKTVQEGAVQKSSYRMIGENHQDLGQVEFQLDGSGGLLSMHVMTE